MQSLATHQLSHFCRVRTLDNAFLGNDHVDQVRRGHIKNRIERLHVCTDPLATHFPQLAAIALFVVRSRTRQSLFS